MKNPPLTDPGRLKRATTAYLAADALAIRLKQQVVRIAERDLSFFHSMLAHPHVPGSVAARLALNAADACESVLRRLPQLDVNSDQRSALEEQVQQVLADLDKF